MMEDVQVYKKRRGRLWLALALLAVLLAIVVIPPMVSISRYKSRITQLISESLGRPVRLSSVELRLLPTPGFVLTDLVVDEDPAFGVEPVLRANTVVASIRLLSLWRGRLEIGTISVDEASFNVVRTLGGRWNLDPLFRTAAAKAGQPAGGGPKAAGLKRAMPLPYIEATHARVNFKQGAEKLPFSLVDTELSFWQDRPGDWSVRLRGQPARTDVSLDLADTGVVRLQATVQRAAELRQMPVHLDAEWREAQLGQLARLVTGSDPGWRGDLTGELHLDGTAEAAQIATRLRATGVHRAEFAPATPMDFDATCNLLYHYSARSTENLVCDSPLGAGRIRVTGDPGGNGVLPRMTAELDRIPVAAGLDALRTVRSDFGPGLVAAGAISGKMTYAPAPASTPQDSSGKRGRSKDSKAVKSQPVVPEPLAGSFTVADFSLSGEGLADPIEVARLSLDPIAFTPPSASTHAADPNQQAGLETRVSIGAEGPNPLAVTARFTLSGYQITVHGPASLKRARELARLAGVANVSSLDALAGDPATLDLNADGPWMPVQSAPLSDVRVPAIALATAGKPTGAPAIAAAQSAVPSTGDRLSGTIALRNANWRADYLANPLEIAQATLHLEEGGLRWDPVVFSYGPVTGDATLELPKRCDPGQVCVPRFAVHFDRLDASALQAAILGAKEPGTLLSTLIERLRPASASDTPAWPALEGTATADSLLLGLVTLTGASAKLHFAGSTVEISGLTANLLGGHVTGGGAVHAAVNAGTQPRYSVQGHFEKLKPAAVGDLLHQHWSGRELDADGKIDLAGFTTEDLVASAKGTLHFDWHHGAMQALGDASEPTEARPAALARFDQWTADATIDNGAIALKNNQVQQGLRKTAIEGLVTLGDPPTVSLTIAKETQARR